MPETNCGVQFTFVLVAPLTVAVKVLDWPTISALLPVTLTVITLAEELLPQPEEKARPKTAIDAATTLTFFVNVVPTFPPLARAADRPPAPIFKL